MKQAVTTTEKQALNEAVRNIPNLTSVVTASGVHVGIITKHHTRSGTRFVVTGMQLVNGLSNPYSSTGYTFEIHDAGIMAAYEEAKQKAHTHLCTEYMREVAA